MTTCCRNAWREFTRSVHLDAIPQKANNTDTVNAKHNPPKSRHRAVR